MSRQQNKKKIITEIVLLALFFGFLLLWSSRQEFGIPSDEALRFAMPKFMFEHHRLPTLFDKELYNINFGCPGYAAQPFLPYIIGSCFMQAAAWFGVKASSMCLVARLVSVICGVIFLFLVFRIGEKLLSKQSLDKLFIVTTALWPLSCFVFTYVNCDALAMVGNALIILNCISGIRNNWKIKNCIGLSIGAILVLLSYINGIGFIIVAAVIFILSYIFGNKKYGQMFAKGALIFVISFAVSSIHYIRNIILYGELLGTNLVRHINLAYDPKWHYGSDWRRAHAREIMFSMAGEIKWVRTNLANFFGYFGSGEIHYPDIVYYVAVPVILILLVLGLWALIRKFGKFEIKNKLLTIGFAVGCIITLMLVWYRNAFDDYTPQGRYSLPMLIPFTLVLTFGIAQVCKWFKAKNYTIATIIVGALLLAADFGAIFFLV